MAVTLARRLLIDPALTDPGALGQAFATAYAQEPWRGYGTGPPHVFALVEQGMSFEQAASSLFDGSGSFGNGAAMRVAPVGLVPAASDPEVARRLASVQARLTHTHVQAVHGAAVVAEVVACVSRDGRAMARGPMAAVTQVVDGLDDGELRARLHGTLELLADGW